MSKNPQTPKIILYKSHEIIIQHNKQYCSITDYGGTVHKISDKRQELWGLFINAHDAEPFLLIYETYNNVDYVADAKPITDDLLKIAVRDIGFKLADRQTEERIKSQAIAYSKDLFCASKLNSKPEMFETAKEIANFIKGMEAH